MRYNILYAATRCNVSFEVQLGGHHEPLEGGELHSQPQPFVLSTALNALDANGTDPHLVFPLPFDKSRSV